MYDEVAANLLLRGILITAVLNYTHSVKRAWGRGRRRFIRELGYWNQKLHPQGMFMKHGKVNKGAH